MTRSVFSLTASRDRERSFESPDWGGGHGIFTYYVVRGLEGEADENRDGIVTADELAEYVRRNVREATEGKQNPTSDRSSFDPDMLLAYVPTGLRADAAAAQVRRADRRIEHGRRGGLPGRQIGGRREQEPSRCGCLGLCRAATPSRA